MEKRFLTVPQVAEMYQVSPWTIYGWISTRKLGFPVIIKVGRLVRIDEKLFEEWLKSNTEAR